jgi:hypothetical protein
MVYSDFQMRPIYMKQSYINESVTTNIIDKSLYLQYLGFNQEERFT